MIKISIIIPVYNGEKYLQECVESVLRQTLREIEVILINDGSKDNTISICRELERKDNRIIVVDKQNEGVSVARNKGIEISKGQYILFVDADDYIEVDMLEKMYNSASQHASDVVFCGFEVNGSDLIKNDTEILLNLAEKNNIVDKEVILCQLISTDENRIHGYIWRNLFRRSLLQNNKIGFPKGIRISEDYMFLLEVINKSEVVSIIPENLYVYRVNNSSVTSKYMPTLHYDMNYINEWMYNNICSERTDTIQGYNGCVANTYLRYVQNLCRVGTPYNLFKRITEAYKIKNKYKYEQNLYLALKNKDLSRKNKLSYIMLLLYFEYIYIILFSIKIKINKKRKNND